MIEIVRKIVEDEIKKMHVAEVGVVTSVFPHSSESDKDNYECNVKLKYRDLELRRVPVATQHVGLANIPHVGDLVLVTFLNGNINAPVVIGRLYTDEDRPPLSKEEEIVYIPPYSKSSSLRRIYMKFPGGITLSITDDEVSVEAGRTLVKINCNGDVNIESNAKINVKANQDFSLSATNISIESRGKLEIKSGGTAKLEATGTLDIKGALVNIN